MNQPHLAENQSKGRWVYAGSLLVYFSLACLLAAAFLLRLYRRPFASVLLTLLLLALVLAIGLHTRYLLLFRREHRETAKALTTTEHEFQSIFDSALDGFLILDDQGKCIETNPAALAILGARREELVGHSIADSLGVVGADPTKDFDLLGDRDRRSEIEILRADGEIAFVEYSLNVNYIPHRHFLALRDISTRKKAEAELQASDERFVQMADNIAEIFWMLDARTKQVIYANRAFQSITGRSLDTLRANPTSYQELFHVEDRVRVLTQLEEAARTGQFDEEFRIVRSDHAVRWVWVRGFPVRNSAGEIQRLVGTAQDVTSRKSAEEQITRSLELARSAWAEADALRQTTLALTQNLSMDYVLDTLLASLLELVPCDSARVLLAETESRLFLARERHLKQGSSRSHASPTTWNTNDHAPLAQVFFTQEMLLVRNTAECEGWKQFKGHSHFQSWLGVPLIASGNVLGLLSLGDSQAHVFTQEHMRLAKSLAIPASVAIQNARLYERAEIYGSELEKRLADLEQVERALERAENDKAMSEGQFNQVFRENPIPFAITTLEDGRFVDVNRAFEGAYGYSRDELIGQTILEVGICEGPNDKARLLQEVGRRGVLKNYPTRIRKSSGEAFEVILSANVLELEGQRRILVATELREPLVRSLAKAGNASMLA